MKIFPTLGYFPARSSTSLHLMYRGNCLRPTGALGLVTYFWTNIVHRAEYRHLATARHRQFERPEYRIRCLGLRILRCSCASQMHAGSRRSQWGTEDPSSAPNLENIAVYPAVYLHPRSWLLIWDYIDIYWAAHIGCADLRLFRSRSLHL